MTDSASNNWYKHAVIYALHIRSFYDSDGDGIGDIQGLIEKLDYIEDLGVDCLSLMPFFPSPLRDDGYDVADYCNVHPDYGTLAQFRSLLDEAHRRGIRIVIDLILNHTSTAHEWFQRARRAPADSPERNFYVWSDSPERFSGAGVLFSDYESSNWEWDNVARAYYWHRFYSHQPDLNYDNPSVREEIRKVLDFWLELGVDGLRLTSVAFLFQREGTTSENLPEVHDFLRELRSHVDEKYPGRILMAETNLWPEDAAEYLGKGDQCHMNYHYPLMPRLYMALQTEDRYPVIDILDQTPPIPDSTQWALFLRNHDDLTLNMVTEEERDYLYKVLAQEHGARINEGIRRRLAPLLGNDRRKIELMYLLLFSLPGAPVLYYGDEIGMGDNIYLGDRKGIRTPMQWSGDRNAGFSNANPQQLYLPVISDPQYRYEAVNVDVQNRNPASLLWWMKNLIAVRKRSRAFSNGSIEFLDARNTKIMAFLRIYEGESILVVVNLSKFSQAFTLNLSEFQGVQPVEVFSRSRFLPIGEEGAYPITLGPYGYYWFQLEKSEEQETPSMERSIPELEVEGPWTHVLDQYNYRRRLEKRILPAYMRSNRWYGGKSRNAVSFEVNRHPAIEAGADKAFLALIDVRFTEGLPDTYFLPLTWVTNAERMVHFLKNEPRSVVCYLKAEGREGILIDAIYEESFRNELFRLIRHDKALGLPGGVLRFEAGNILTEEPAIPDKDIRSEVLRAEQSNTSVIYNDQFFFKIYRKLDTDINPDLELVRYLSERTNFRNAPRYGGGIQYEERAGQSFTILGLLQNKIPNQGEAWTLMLDTLGRYYEKVAALPDRHTPPDLVNAGHMIFEQAPEQLQSLIEYATYERVSLLARRTAEMHIALASEPEDPAFAPERFTPHYQRSIYSAHRKLVAEKLDALEAKLPGFPAHVAADAQAVLELRKDILQCFNSIYSTSIDAVKTRIHGDYHLGQVLYDGKDFFIIDFEGEPMLSIGERRLKRTPFKDVAGMIRSFHYAAYGKLLLNPNTRREDMAWLEQWARQWYHYVSGFFLTAYLERAAGQPFIPSDPEATKLLLRTYLLEKAIYEVGYEMNARPEWLRIPLKGVLFEME